MRRYAPLVLAVLLSVTAIAAMPVAGHGNHLTTNAQVVDDAVVVERAFVLQDGYAVVHLDQGGSMGRVLGHTEVPSGPSENFEIDVDQEFLSRVDGSAKVWVVLHRDDGDGEFETSHDTPITGVQGQAAGVIVPIRVNSDGNVNVVARDFGDQTIDEPAVVVPRVESNTSGFVAIEDGDGEVVGTTRVDAGVHDNVTVELADSFFESLEENESRKVTAAVYRDDGDGAFDADADRAVRAGEDRVASDFSIKRVANANRTTSLVVTASETTAPTTTTGDDDTTAKSADEGDDGEESAQPGGPSPGFGVAVGVLAVLAATALARRA